MANKHENEKKRNDSIVVDYLIVLLYIVIVAILFWTLLCRVDFMVAYVLPYGTIIAVSAIFINYLQKILGTPKK